MRRHTLSACVIAAVLVNAAAAEPDPAETPDLKAILEINWPDVETLRAAHRQHLIDAQPGSSGDGRVEWAYLASSVAQFSGFIEGAVKGSVIYQEWAAADPDRFDFAGDVWADPTFPPAERDRLTALVVESREWGRLRSASEPLVFLWPEPAGMDFSFPPGTMSLRGAPYSLYRHLARGGDIVHFREFTVAMLGCARATDVQGNMLGRIIANSHRMFAYERTIDMIRSHRGAFDNRQLADLSATIAADQERVPLGLVLQGNYIAILDYLLEAYEAFREVRPEIKAIAEGDGEGDGWVDAFMRSAFERAGLWSEEDATTLPDPRLDLEAIDSLPEIFAQITSDNRAASDAGIARYQELFDRVESDEVFASQRPVFAMTLPAWTHLVDASAFVETTRHAAIAVIALERYRMVHGEYPPDLETLVPEYMNSVPYDRDAEGPVVYRRVLDDEGQPDYIMYAIGPDRTDDGGTVFPKYWSSPAFNPSRSEDKGSYDLVFTAIEPY